MVPRVSRFEEIFLIDFGIGLRKVKKCLQIRSYRIVRWMNFKYSENIFKYTQVWHYMFDTLVYEQTFFSKKVRSRYFFKIPRRFEKIDFFKFTSGYKPLI